MEIAVTGDIPKDPRQRILAIEATMKAICQSADEDAADGTMALLTAAVHITMKHSGLSKAEAADVLADVLAHAINAAYAWWPEDRPASTPVRSS